MKSWVFRTGDRVANWIWEPSTEIISVHDRERAQILSALMICFQVALALALWVMWEHPEISDAMESFSGIRQQVALTFAINLGAYFLSRTRHYRMAGGTFIGSHLWCIFSNCYLYPVPEVLGSALIWLPVLACLCGLVFSIRATCGLTLACAAGIAGLWMRIGPECYSTWLMQATFFTSCSVLNLLTALMRWHIHAARARAEERLAAQQARLVIASKMSALGEMAGGIAHEINNPLAIVVGKASLLRRMANTGQMTPEHVVQATGAIEKTALRISKIVRSLKTFSREAKGDPFVPVPLRSIIDDTLELCSERFRNHAVALRVSGAIDELQIQCRAVEVGQVLLNLLSNAYDATEGQPEKWVEVQVADVGEDVEISVTDSGPGIPADLREKIMDPFFTTKEVGKGTGLGLSVSLGIVESHGGRIWLDDSHLHTRFVVLLPKRQEDPAIPGLKRPEERLDAVPSHS